MSWLLSLFMILASLTVSSAFLFVSSASAQQTSISLSEAREIFVAPSAGLKAMHAAFSSPDLTSDHLGAELGIKIVSSSNRARTFFAGFDIRQFIGTRELFETKLGLNLEWQTSLANFSGAWYFGDTVVTRERDLQMNGNSFTLGVSRWVHRWKIFAEATYGRYEEGPGFIYISRNSGPERLSTSSLMVGVEFPIYAGDVSNLPEGSRVRPTSGHPYAEPDL
jgi:hypothetical protein